MILPENMGQIIHHVRDYRKLKGNMEAQETVSCVILMVNAMLRLCEIPAIKRILESDDMDIKSLGTGADGIPGKKTALFFGHCRINDPSFKFFDFYVLYDHV